MRRSKPPRGPRALPHHFFLNLAMTLPYGAPTLGIGHGRVVGQRVGGRDPFPAHGHLFWIGLWEDDMPDNFDLVGGGGPA